MPKPTTEEPKTFYIGFLGTSHFRPVIATSVKQAKQKFAAYEGMLRVSSSIVQKRSVDGAIEQMKPIV